MTIENKDGSNEHSPPNENGVENHNTESTPNEAGDVDNTQTGNQDLDDDDRREQEILERESMIEAARIQADKEIGNSSKMRFWGGEKVRPFIYIGATAMVLAGVGTYMAISGLSNDPLEDDPSSISVPKSRAKASNMSTPEQAEYLRALHEKNAMQANAEGTSYIAGFVNEAPQADDLSGAPVVQPGVASSNLRQQYFDKDGNVYSLEQAIELSAQNQKIEGVTYGQGSIEDQVATTGANTIPVNGAYQNKPLTSATTRSQVTPYAVLPYSGQSSSSSSSLSGGAVDNAQSSQLDEAKNSTEQWKNNYLALRVSKAQMVDAKVQKALSDQATAITNAIKPEGDVAAAYSSQVYKVPQRQQINATATANPTNTTTQPSITAKPIARAGESFRAILKTQVNTDQGSDVLATILSGPLKGSTAVGSVKVSSGNIQLAFNKVLRKDKDELGIDAVARTLGDNSLGMADDIQKHYFQKYGSLVASSLLSGVGQAYEQTAGADSTISNGGVVVTNSTDPSSERILGNAAGELGNSLSSDIRSAGARPITYIVNKGKVFNLFLNSNVVDGVAQNNQNLNNRKQ